jgi:TolB-like protein
MKRPLITLYCLLFLTALLPADPAIAVIDFDSGDYCTAEKAAIMTDLFRNELIRSGRADIVDRRNIERIKAEMRFQMSDYADPARVKQIGRMIGADYLMTGNFDMLGDTLYLVVQLLDIETVRALYSSRMTLVTWDEYDRKVRPFAEEFIKKLPRAEIFTGIWSTDILYNDSFDTYRITFTGPNRCTVAVTSAAGGVEIIQEAEGTYSYDGTIFKVNAAFRNSRIPHITTVQWSSVLSFNDGSTAFNILAKPASNNNNQVRVTFTKE